jgi:predicted anti-sigma-YlaC factor YlaD
MNCKKIQEQISLYLDNKLSSAEINELMKHLDNCLECKQIYNDLVKVKKILSVKQKINISSNFTDSVMQSIYKLPAKKKDSNVAYINVIRKYFVIAASFIFVLFASLFVVMQQAKSNLSSPIFDSEAIFEAYDYQVDNIYENDVTAFISMY